MELSSGAGGTAGSPGRGLGRPWGGELGADPELSRERSGAGGCSHMGMEVTELSAVKGMGRRGRAESVFREQGCEFSGKPGRTSD